MLKRKFILLIIGIFTIGLISCAKIEDKATNSKNAVVAEVTGTIEDGSSNPIDDVLVTIEGRSEHTYTNNDGEFVMYLRPRSDTGHVWTEDISLYFQKEGYTTFVNGSSSTSLSTGMDITIERGRTTTVRVILN